LVDQLEIQVAADFGHDLFLLLGVEPGRCGHHEAGGLQRMIADLDLCLRGEKITEYRAGKHRRVNLLAVGNQRVAGERVVMLPTRQLADATDGTIDSLESAAVALTPHHPFVVGGRDLAPTLDQRAVPVEKQLRVVHSATVAFVYSDGDDHASAAGG